MPEEGQIVHPAQTAAGAKQLTPPREGAARISQEEDSNCTAAKSQHSLGADDSCHPEELLSAQTEPPPDVRYLQLGPAEPL